MNGAEDRYCTRNTKPLGLQPRVVALPRSLLRNVQRMSPLEATILYDISILTDLLKFVI